MPLLSVVIPAYNEAPAIRAGKLHRAKVWLSGQSFATELIVVDDGSQDDTAALAQAIADKTVEIPHAGKAAAVVAGLEQAGGDIVLFTDMDQATPISEAPKLLGAIGDSAAVAIGSRGLARPGAPVRRYVLSWGQVALRTLLLGLRMTDTQCGFKAMTRTAAHDILAHLRLYHPGRPQALQGPSVTSGFDVELLFVARRLGYEIREVPVVWNYQDTRRVSLARDTWRGARDLWKIVAADWRGQYPKRGLGRPLRHRGRDRDGGAH
jgi:glycosyltransferase involved in cell wall biosynthesis